VNTPHHSTRRRRVPAALAVCVAAAAILGACTSGEAESSAPSTTTSPVLGDELVGRWAHYDVVAYEGDPLKTLIISYGFTDFAVEDGRLVESEEFCHADQASNQPIETTISDVATRAIIPISTPVEVSEVDGALRVQRPATPTPVGIRLADPANDRLPTDPTDPRIVDDDNDGNPGITVHVKVGEGLEGDLFIARREIFAYDMTADGPDSLTGTVKDSSEQLVVGTTNPVLATGDAQWVQYPDLARSPILLRRVGADYDCDRLMAERPTLFPADPAADW
jgi:hypothetical protein